MCSLGCVISGINEHYHGMITVVQKDHSLPLNGEKVNELVMTNIKLKMDYSRF